MERSEQFIALGVIAGIVIVGFALFFWLAPSSTAPTQTKTVAAGDLVSQNSPMTGTSTAKVTLVEWGDFECPFCGAEAPIIKQLIATYGSNPNFNFVFRNFPLPQHKNAPAAAEAALAAGAQGKYWQMYEQLYANQKDWVDLANPRTAFDGYAKALGLDLVKFDRELDAHTYAPIVQADLAQATQLHLNHTPTLFLNGVEQTDVSLTALTQKINTALQQ
jgi:protein-disulfide isomerase